MAGESAAEASRPRRDKGARLRWSDEPYELAAEGERRTAAALEELPEIWTVVHDLRWPGHKYATIDHVVIGPPGVFVIDSQTWTGDLLIRPDLLRHDGYSQHREVAAAVEAATAVAVLTRNIPRRNVHPVLCIVRDQPVEGRVGEVLVCSTENVVETLESMVHELSSSQIHGASLDLSDHLHDPKLVKKAAKFGHAPARRAAWRTSSAAVLRLAIVVGAVVVILAFPGEIVDAFESVRDFVTEQVSGS